MHRKPVRTSNGRVVGGAHRTGAAALSALVAAAVVLAGSPAAAQLTTNDSNVGYIDSAIPAKQLRLRFDAAYDSNFPDRAEFFYGAWRRAALGAPGPPLAESLLDYQELSALVEVSPFVGFSVFGELPVRFLDPERNDNAGGLGDVIVGAKWAFYEDSGTMATLQLRVFAPSGDAERGLGTDHASVEPGLLVYHRWSERLTLEGELREWIPIDGTDGFAGEVLRYGAGASYLVHQSCRCAIRPVVELVGWTVLDGRKSSEDRIVLDAGGDTIVNVKAGVRFGFGYSDYLGGDRHSLYIGYGRAVTGHVWYEDIARIEYRLAF